jgi:glutamate-1-semialdehyde 2,1-aminomutase
MAAGLAMLKALDADRDVFIRLKDKTAYLAAGINKVLTNNNVPLPSIPLIYDIGILI